MLSDGGGIARSVRVLNLASFLDITDF